MRLKYILPIILIALLHLSQYSHSQTIDSTSVKFFTRLSFYTTEKTGEFLVHIPDVLIGKNLDVDLFASGDTLASWSGVSRKDIIRITFPLFNETADHKVKAKITSSSRGSRIYTATSTITVLQYKPNEVKTDRLTGGLIVNKLPFFPFGFYTYSPVDPTLPEEEVIRGFNMISPYQRILPETLPERKAYMDRCAQIGMKVHYNLLSVSGGGGVGSRIEGLDSGEKRKRMISEINMFRDHPALLGWYIADEPNGYKIPPEQLEEIYNIVRQHDPWHPVSIVFMAPFLSARQYEKALDIVMADPYPLPDLPVTLVGNVAGELRDEFEGRRPVWIVPQAFGGGELWSREPTIQEIRSMTWQSIARGATGIQFFVRQGPNYFPKSPATWAECGRMAMEVAELTPWLLSDEDAPEVESSSKNIIASTRSHNGKIIVMAVNKVNEPSQVSLRIRGLGNVNAKSLFENRSIKVSGGTLTDNLPAFGTHVYLLDTHVEVKRDVDHNLLTDPGFEDLSSPGIPSACYARPGGDRGATYFLDSRVHFEGDHSLRLVTPVQNKPVSIRFYPVKLRPGASYIISLWAKSDPEQRFRVLPVSGKNIPVIDYPQYVEIQLGEFSHSWFVPGKEWKQYVTFVTIPPDISGSIKANLILKMPGQGVAWFDQIRIVEEKY